jgi:hypothetical protein
METELMEQKTFVCFSCMQPNESGRDICKFCNTPISQTSSNDPLQIAFGEGLAYRKAAIGKPKPIVVFGIWLLFLPMFVFCSYTAVETAFTATGSVGFVLFWVMLTVAGFRFLMLYRVTRNYLYFEENKRD